MLIRINFLLPEVGSWRFDAELEKATLDLYVQGPVRASYDTEPPPRVSDIHSVINAGGEALKALRGLA